MVKLFTSIHNSAPDKMIHNQNLENLLLGRWENIAVQGGVLERDPKDRFYLLFGMWVFCNQNWVEISVPDADGIYDESYLEIETSVVPPVPDQEKSNLPRRQLLRTFPANCRLDRFSGEGVVEIAAGTIRQRNGAVLVHKHLIIRSKYDYKITVSASEEYPGSITMQEV